MWQQVVVFLLSPLLKYMTVFTIVGAIGIGIYFVTPRWLPFDRRFALMVGVGSLVCGAFYWWAFAAGEAHMTQRMAARDAVAVQRVERAVYEVQRCEQNGGTWDVTTGNCN